MTSGTPTPREAVRIGPDSSGPAPLIGLSTGFTDDGDYLGIALSSPLEALGAAPIVIPYLDDPSSLLPKLDGLVVGPGRDLEPWRAGSTRHPTTTAHSPLRDRTELTLVRAALAVGVPLLGVCRGMQVINVALDGTLHADHSLLPPPADRHPRPGAGEWRRLVEARLSGGRAPSHPTHEIVVAEGSLLHEAIGPRATVNSYHHQSIDDLGSDVSVSARARDGVVEAIEVPSGAFCLGVQWELQEEPGSPVFDLLVAAARHRREARGELEWTGYG